MIRIRHEDFSAGTHEVTGLYGKAEGGPRGITLSLRPGLTTGQRRAVIRRLRQEGSRGFGPPLPQWQLAIALGLDRVRTAARIIRLHPLVTLVPGALVIAVMALFVMASADGQGAAAKARAGYARTAPAAGASHQPALMARPVPLRPSPARVVAITVTAGMPVPRCAPGGQTVCRRASW